ncbi:MAG: DUF2711 family protein [Flavobacterium sp.]|nr:DUF2711 family protein [Flavobacterium sp.]
MSDILNNNYNNLYPHEGSIIEFFAERFSSAFITLLPFFQVENQNNSGNFKKSKIISFEEAQKDIDVLKNIQSPNATIYSYSNDDFPADEEVFHNGKRITWKDIVEKSGLKNEAELNKALRTSIGALREVFIQPKLAQKLQDFTQSKQIYNPVEGSFDIISKKAIYETLKKHGKNMVFVIDEFYEKEKYLNLEQLTEWEFVEKIENGDKYILSEDQKILFSIEWDSFFFIIASNNELIESIKTSELFEGFECNSETTHNWDYDKGEIDKLLEIEKRTTSKSWWKFWK